MLLIFVFLLVAAELVGALTFNTTLINRESLRQKLIREKKFDEFRILRRVRSGARRSRAHRMDVVRQPFYDYSDAEYLAQITIGNPEQPFNVIMDTASSNLWVTDKTCTGYPCKSKRKFDSAKSKDYKKDGRKWKVPYKKTKGFLGQDTVALGDKGGPQLVIPKTTFAQATELADNLKEDRLDGVLGLALESLAVDDVQPVFEHAVELGLVDQPIFTIWLKKDGRQATGQIGGQITYGGLDTQHCSRDVDYTYVIGTVWWKFNVNAVGVNGKMGTVPYSGMPDTSSSMIVGLIEPLQELIVATDAQYDYKFGLYSANCNTKFTWSVWIENREYRLDQSDMLLEIEKGSCVLAYESEDEEYVDSSLVLGLPFLRRFCTIYKVEKDKADFYHIGFAESTKS